MSRALARARCARRAAVVERNGGDRRQDDRRRHVCRLRRSAGRAAAALALAAVRSPIRRRPAASPLRVRCGLHLGVVERRDDDLFGSAVNRAARIMKAAHGGQVLLSQAVVDALRDALPHESSLRDLGAVRLRDLAPSRARLPARAPGAARSDFPALRSLEATPNNLPQQVTSFIGRERELAEIKAAARQYAPADAARHGRPRQDAAVAAGRAPTCSTSIPTASGSSTWRRSRIRCSCRRPWPPGARRAGRAGQAAHADARASTCKRPQAAAGPRQLRALRAVRARRSPTRCCARPELRILATSREPLRIAASRPTRCCR